MPFALPIAMAASAGIGAYAQHRTATNAQKAQQPLISAQTALAAQQAAIAKLAGPALTESSDYYRRLLSGNRAALTSALSPELTGVSELFRGASKNLSRSAAGPQRDVAAAELNRDRVGKMAGLLPQARNSAAASLTNLGSVAMGGAGTAGNLFESLTRNAQYNRAYTDQSHEALGESIGPLLIDFYKAWQTQSGASKVPKVSPVGLGTW